MAQHPHKNIHTVEADNEDRVAIKVIQMPSYADIFKINSCRQAAAQKVAEITGGSLDVLILNGAMMMHERGVLNFDQL